MEKEGRNMCREHNHQEQPTRFVCNCRENENNNRRKPVTLFCNCHEVSSGRDDNHHHHHHCNKDRHNNDVRGDRDHRRGCGERRGERNERRNRRRCHFCGHRWF